ncbi:MAG: hypothetical protein ABI806_02660 [Candidatus Solibacter sp.]
MKGCDPYTHSSDPFNRLNAACLFAPSVGSIGLESGINYLNAPGVVNFDIAAQKEFSFKEGRIKFQFRVDAFNAFNHTNFTGYNATLNFNAYPNTNGIVNGAPTLVAKRAGAESQRHFQRDRLRHRHPDGTGRAGLPAHPADTDPRDVLVAKIATAAGGEALRFTTGGIFISQLLVRYFPVRYVRLLPGTATLLFLQGQTSPPANSDVEPQTCAPCHAAIARTYAQTGMGRSFYRPQSQTPMESLPFLHQASGAWYSMVKRGGQYFQR